MLASLISLISDLSHHITYNGIWIMTALESTFVPFPSEIPMTLAGMKSAEGLMNPWIAFLVGLFGVWIGTTINYLIGYYIGDAFVEKYGKYFFIKPKHYHHAQKLFEKDADFYTFFGRLLPVVRHLISIPAGMVHMPYGRFITLSLIGSALWLAVLIIAGYLIGDNLELIHTYLTSITFFCFLLALVIWYINHRRKKSRKATEKA